MGLGSGKENEIDGIKPLHGKSGHGQFPCKETDFPRAAANRQGVRCSFYYFELAIFLIVSFAT